MKKQEKMIELEVSEEIRLDVQNILRKSIADSFNKINKKYGEDLHFALAIHILTCIAFEIIYHSAPDIAEGDRFIKQALDEVKELNNQ